MRNDGAEREVGELGEIEGQLVDVLDHDVVSVRAQQPPHGGAGVEREAEAPARAVHAQPVELGGGRGPGPAARDEVDDMTPAGESAEDLVQVDLGPARVRVRAVVPVDEQQLHSAPSSRATASSTPFTNPGAFGPANQ